MLTSGKGHTGGKQRREVMFLYEAQNAGKNLQRCKYADYWDISKSYWKFQGSRVMKGKGSFPPGWLFSGSILRPTDQQLFWPLSLLQFSLAAMTVMKSGERNSLLSVLGTLCLVVSSQSQIDVPFPADTPQSSLGPAPTTIQAELDFFSVSGPLSKP